MKLHELHEAEERSVLSVKGQQEKHFAGDFSCGVNQLISLEGSPSSVSGYFYCAYNELTSLDGAPSSVDHDFICAYNKLTSLEGAPSSVGGHFNCADNKLTSLRDIHKQIKHIGESADFSRNPITSHVLGLLRISGLTGIFLDNKKVETIITKHLKGDRDIFACQDELIEAGFEEFAQL